MKIKMFSNPILDKLEKEVNDFLKTITHYKDIKFSTDISKTTVLILYEE